MPAVNAYAVAQAAARAAERVEGVVDLDGGPLGSFSTYGDGRSCSGVTVTATGDELEVRVRLIAAFGTVLPRLAAQVRAAVGREVGGWAGGRMVVVDIEITDLAAAAS